MRALDPCPVCGDPASLCAGHPQVEELVYEVENGLITPEGTQRRLAWCGITEDVLARLTS